ncbi:MAG TPA: phospho-N-acetylmuramoyl-pentapeptide-transferase [Actinomycetota bacterium]|nr:phospho-N-acetylmuramoyl-pentapeptide-transferase [Actinomycetota bacterium]
MRQILAAAALSFLLVLIFTPVAIRILRRKSIGQFVREDGPKAHIVKKGTPTMGGIVIIAGSLAAYAVSHFVGRPTDFTPSGLLAMGTLVAMGILGFIDDYLKINRRRSLGLNKTAKLLGQAAVAVGFVFAARFTQAIEEVSFVRPLGFALVGVLFALWVFLIIAATTNGTNLADGLDGLCCGSGAMVMGAYVIITFWQFRHPCLGLDGQAGCYLASDSLDLALVAASMVGSLAGFLWWNAAPAKIFMGDTGSLALGGGMAALAILTNTQLLLIVLGGLYVVEVSSVVLQVIAFRVFKRRIFLMAPIHHHFELLGWPEFTVIVRFWVLAALSIAFGLGLFYGEFINAGGAG